MSPAETPILEIIEISSTVYPRPDNFSREDSLVFKISVYLLTAPKLKNIKVAKVMNQCDIGTSTATAPKYKRKM